MTNMKIVKFTKQEKKRIWEMIPNVFEEKQATMQFLSEHSKRIGIATRYLEIMLWQIDTLYVLQSLFGNIVWKGGTCIQSYLKPEYQRYSVDLDLNTSLDRKGIFEAIKNINKRLRDENRVFSINDISIGDITFHSENEILGVLNFFRLVPFKHGGEYSFKEIKILGVIPIRIQFNYKFYEENGFIALREVYREPKLAPYGLINTNFSVPHESPEDLIADKLIAMAEIKGIHRGRLRLKDSYDIVALISNLKVDFNTVRRKLELIAESWGIEYNMLIKKALESLEEISRREFEALGLKGSVGFLGYQMIVNNWKGSIIKIKKLLEGELV